MDRMTRLFAGGVAALAVAAAAAACGDDTVRVGSSSKPASGQEQLARDSAVPATNAYAADGSSSKGAVAAAATAPASAPAPSLSAALDRKIIFNATLNLGARDVTSTFNLASRIATNSGGFVEKSSFTGSDDTAANLKRTAALTLRVPADRYQPVLADLRAMDGVSVKSESSKSSEVTEQYTDLQSRLRNLERTETQYLALLAQAKTVDEILKMTDRVDSVRAQIEQAQGRLKVLDHLTDLATIDLAITPLAVAKSDVKSNGGPKGAAESFADAWEGSIEAVRYLASAGAVLAVFALWLAVPTALAVAGTRYIRRRGHGTAVSG